jgi:hypothetical protein
MLTTKTLTVGAAAKIAKGSTVVVEDELGNPLVVVIETSQRMNMVVTCNDSDFNQVLQQLGINKVVIDEPMQLAGPPSGAQVIDKQQLAGFLNDS